MIILNSCQKEESFDNANQGIIAKVKQWMDEQKKEMFANKAAKVDLLKVNLEYSNLRIEQSAQNEKIIIIPIMEGFKAQKIPDKNSIPNLILLMNASGDIRKGNVVLFKPNIDGKYYTVPHNIFYNIYNTGKVNCNGLFEFLSIAGQRQYHLEYKNGKLFSFGLRKKKEPANQSGRTSTMCYDVVLVTTYYYEDGSTDVTEEYLGTTCSEDCGQPNPWPTDCPDGSSPGGGGINDVDYEYAVTKPWKWTVGLRLEDNTLTIRWLVRSYENISGIKKASEPCGGHFTNIVHQSSYLDTGNGYTWTEFGNTPTIPTPCKVQSSVTGKVTKTSNSTFETISNTDETYFNTNF